MKKLLIVLGIILVLAGVLFYVQYVQMSRAVQPVFVPQVQNQETKKESEEIVLDKEKQIGNLVFNYSNNFEFLVDEKDTINLNLKIKSVGNDRFTGQKTSTEYTPVRFFFDKNENPKKLSIEKWFDINSPEFEKQSFYDSLAKESITIDGINAYKVRFQSNTQITGGYYDLISIYIPYGTDIYQIDSYAVPLKQDDPSLALNDEDIKNTEAYEKIVDQIIQSIHFVK
ncbi:MAG: hypothetical protein WCO58_01475 [bacterium]